MMTNCKKLLFEYDVFLNHRGPDTKEQFVVPLIKKLKEAGIQRSFMDRQNVLHGENVFQVIEAACESARMHIAFFSKEYAHSKYCLKELHQMFLTERPIITVFYDVLPEHVRRPRRKDGHFAEGLRKHEKREKPHVVNSWVAALERAADLRGFVRANYKDDDEWIAKDIVEEVVRLLRPTTVTIPPRGGQYDWSSHYELSKKGQGIMYFTAETHRNLHVTFSPKVGIVYPSYEIVIGHQLSSTAQTRSEIRRQEPESTVCSWYPLDLDVLEQDTDGGYQFWICIDEETQFIHVGRGEHAHEENAFIIFKDPSFLTSVQYFAFSSSQVAITYKNIRAERRPPSVLLGRESSSSRMWSSIDSTRDSRQEPESISPEITSSRSVVGEYNWSMAYQLPSQGRGIVCFSVRAITTNIVHVAISPKRQTTDPMYEVVIGGWGNSECVLRRKVQGDILCRVRTIDAIVKVGKVNHFWMSINTDTQLIHVGAGNQPNPASILLVYKDPCFIIDARYVSFLSWETDVVYSNVVVGCPSTRKLLVPRSVKLSPLRGKYEWDQHQFSSEGQGILYFAVEARNDVMLAISPKRETVDPMYEIVMGNTRPGLRRCAQGEFVCSVNHGLTNPEGLNHIWVSIDKETQLIQIGEQADDLKRSAFLMFKDPSFLCGAVYFAFSSWSTPVTYSAVSVSFQSATITKPIQPSRKPTFPGRQHASTLQTATFRCKPSANSLLQDPGYVVKILQNCRGQYDWFQYFELPSMGRGEIYFAAETFRDIHAAISPSPKTMNAMYEIVIGGWNNSKSVIRRAPQGDILCCAESEEDDPPINVRAGDLNYYWVSINASTQLIKVGRGKESEIESSVLMVYKDAHFLSDARYVAFSNWDAPVTYSNISLGTIPSEIELGVICYQGPATMGYGLDVQQVNI